MGPRKRKNFFFSKLSVFSYFIIFIFSIGGCGYTTGSNLPGHLNTIYVTNFENKINFSDESRKVLYFPLLEEDVRNAVIRRFQFDGNLKISSKDNADLILKGTLLDYQRGILRKTDNDNAEEYRIHIIVSLEMYDVVKQQVLWAEPNFAGEATYFVTGPKARSEEAGLKDALDDLARRVVERTVEDW